MHQGATAVDTCRQMGVVFGQEAYSDHSIFQWHRDFSNGRTKLGDLFRKGGPKLARNATMVAQCRRKVDRNRRVTIDHLSNSMGISHGSIHSILHKDLQLSKRACKLVPHVLNAHQRQQRLDFCRNFLREYSGRLDRMNKLITCDESYFHVWDPLSKLESRQWLTRDMNRPQMPRKEQSTKKVMFLPFFDRKGMLHYEFFHDMTVNRAVFHQVLQRLRVSIRVRRRAATWIQHHSLKLHMDNASAHQCDVVQACLQNMSINVLKHPPYSLDLSPCDFFLFPILNKRMRGIEFRTIDNVMQEVVHCVGEITQEQWEYCYQQWIARCEKCIQFDGRYFEGMKHRP